MTFSNGISCEGEFSNNLLNGQGTLETEFYVYEGAFVNGNLHGKGKLVFQSGEFLKEDSIVITRLKEV